MLLVARTRRFTKPPSDDADLLAFVRGGRVQQLPDCVLDALDTYDRLVAEPVAVA